MIDRYKLDIGSDYPPKIRDRRCLLKHLFAEAIIEIEREAITELFICHASNI